jgi:hypothetical protein
MNRQSNFDKKDRIEGDRIIIFDPGQPDKKTLKQVEIVTPQGIVKIYEIKRTAKGGYLFN